MEQQYFNRPHYAEFASDQHLIDHFSHLTILRSGILANWNISQFLALKQKFILFCGHLLMICIVHVKDIEPSLQSGKLDWIFNVCNSHLVKWRQDVYLDTIFATFQRQGGDK